MGRYGRAAGRRAGAAGRAARGAAIVAALCLLSGCGLLGSTDALRRNAADSMTVTSPMVEQGTIAARYTCHGAGTSPPILWSNLPANTKSLALVVDDSSAPITPRVYWIVFDISPAARDLQAGSLPTGARQARNSAGKASYDPPCPAGGPHKYRFTIYALSRSLHQPNGTHLRAAWTAIARSALAWGRLTATAAGS